MKLYADVPARRTSQILGDVLLVMWIIGWWKVAGVVHEATLRLAGPGEEMHAAGSGLAARMRDAGAAVDDTPLIGDSLRAPFDGAGDAAEDLDLFALRALARQPMQRLAAISDDPAGDWRRRDTAVVRRLAVLELREVGLRPPD